MVMIDKAIFDCFSWNNRYSLGFIGNVLSLLIFCSLAEFRKISTGTFFLFTTVSNSIHLWTLTTEFLGVFNVYVYADGFWQCRMNYFVQNVSRAMSTYLAIGIALDRFIRSELSLRSRWICTRRNAVIYTLTIFVIFSLLWSVWLCPTIVRDEKTGKCITNNSSLVSFLLVQVQVPARAVVVCLLPVFVMTAANVRMLYNMRRSRRRVENRAEPNTSVSVPISAMPGASAIRRMTDVDRMLFYMMLANVGTFIITQIPFHLYTFIRSYYPTLDPFTNSLVRAVLLVWSSIYFGVAFYVYCLASPLFRKKFLRIGRKLHHFLKCRPL